MSTSRSASGGGTRTAAWLIAILAVAFNLRIAIVGVGPVIEDIRADTGMSSAVAGTLAMIPFLCMGVFALVGFPLLRLTGPARLIGLSLLLLGLGTLARAAAPSAALVVLATVPIGVGIALIGLALPGVVKALFPNAPGAITGAYVASLSGGGALAALVIVPLGDELGGWRWAFAVMALPVLVALPLWLRLPAALHAQAEVAGARLRRARNGLRLALIFGCQSACFAAVVSWVGALYRDEGWSDGAAALATSIVPLMTVPAALLIPRLSDGRDRRPSVVAMTVLMTAGMLGLALLPTTAAWVWLVAVGLGSGALFPLALTLPLDLGDTQAEVDTLSAWTQGVGYLLGAFGPVLVGALRDVSGGFALPMAIIGVLGAGSGLAAIGLRRRAA